MAPCLRVRVSAVLLAVVTGGACEPGVPFEEADTAATERKIPSAGDLAPEGFLLAAGGTHVRPCTGPTCATMWADTPRPNNCGGDGVPIESYMLHQRGVDWDGVEGEAELHGATYQLSRRLTGPGTEPEGTLPTLHNQSVVVQCCDFGTVIAIAMKVCPDPCDSPDGRCPITLATGPSSIAFGSCRTTSGVWQLAVPHCDLQVVEAGWKDPHAPHDLADPSGEDKRVFNIYYAPWNCGDGLCDPGEEEACDDDCA